MPAKKAPATTTTPTTCCVFDVTSYDVPTLNVPDIRRVLGQLCKSYCFQTEKGEESGKLHYQMRISLKQKSRSATLAKTLRGLGWDKIHVAPTSKANRTNNFYVMKEDTRVDGPYTDENDIYIPRDIRNIQELYPFQQQLRDLLSLYDERGVHLVYDPNGKIGKSTFIRYMCLYHNAELLPFVNDYKDLMRMAYDVGPKTVYLVDMPRAISKDKLFQMYSAIETLKSGYCFDDRFGFKRRFFDRPNICVFTNTMPDLSLLSADMWRLHQVSKGANLVGIEDDINDVESLPEHFDDPIEYRGNNRSSESIGVGSELLVSEEQSPKKKKKKVVYDYDSASSEEPERIVRKKKKSSRTRKLRK